MYFKNKFAFFSLAELKWIDFFFFHSILEWHIIMNARTNIQHFWAFFKIRKKKTKKNWKQNKNVRYDNPINIIKITQKNNKKRQNHCVAHEQFLSFFLFCLAQHEWSVLVHSSTTAMSSSLGCVGFFFLNAVMSVRFETGVELGVCLGNVFIWHEWILSRITYFQWIGSIYHSWCSFSWEK